MTMTDEALTIHKTLAGEEILVYEDSAFAELAGFEAGSHSYRLSLQMPRSRLTVLKVLYRHGKIVDKSGFSVGHLADRVREFDAIAFNVNAVLQTPMMQACVERVTSGRRTMSIAITALPKSWLRLIEGSLSEEVDPAELDEPDTDSRLSAEHPLEHAAASPLNGNVVEGQLAGAVAMSLLAQCIEVLSTNGADMLVAKNAKLTEELTHARQRLGEQTGYVDGLRKQLRQAQDAVIAAQHERDGLRARALAAESNLAIALSPEAAKLLEGELHREVDKLMRQRPGTSYEKPGEKPDVAQVG